MLQQLCLKKIASFYEVEYFCTLWLCNSILGCLGKLMLMCTMSHAQECNVTGHVLITE